MHPPFSSPLGPLSDAPAATSLRRGALAALTLAAAIATSPSARADDAPTGAPPPEAKALVSAPSAPASAPATKDDKALDVTTAAVSAGGQITTGNSRVIQGTARADYQTRFSDNGFGASILGNYAQTGKPSRLTAQNLQGRVRYDRYLLDELSVFLINTGRNDRFQGYDFRYNLDPGVKYLFWLSAPTTAWGELGYDLQYDIRRNADRNVYNDDGTLKERLDKTQLDHSTRAFLGFTHAFNDEVTLNLGLEYLQSVVHAKQARLNFDALLAAHLTGGFSIGAGFSARYDASAKERGKLDLDTQTTLNVIYAFSDAEPPEPAPAPCPPPPPPPACPPAAAASPAAPAPAPAAAPAAPEPDAAPAPAPTSPAGGTAPAAEPGAAPAPAAP